MVLKITPVLLIIELLLATAIFFTSIMLYRIWNKLRSSDTLMLALPSFLLLSLVCRLIHGIIWLVQLPGKDYFIGMFITCEDNLAFAFFPITLMSLSILVNASIWLNFIMTSYLLLNNFIALLRMLRRCIFILLILFSVLFVILPLVILLIFACEANGFKQFRLYTGIVFTVLAI